MICKYILFVTFLNESKHIGLDTVTLFLVLLCTTFNSIIHQPFVYTQLNVKTVLLQTIQFSMSHLFALSLNIKQFYLTY